MKWLVIASSVFETEKKDLINFFEEEVCDLEFYDFGLHFSNVSDESDEYFHSFKNLCSILENISHCILLLDGSERSLAAYHYVMGFLEGKNRPTFVYSSKRTLFAFGHYFSDFHEMKRTIRENFEIYIQEEKKQYALRSLFNKGIPFNPDSFSFSISSADSDICELFYEGGMDVNVCDAAGIPMVCIAARSGNKEMIEWLIQKGANINAVSADRGYSPVMDAVWKNNLEIVSLLVGLGAELNGISRDGQSVLVLATGTGNSAICEVLVKGGADPFVKDHMGMSAFDYAKLFKKETLVNLYNGYRK
ncbi:MAG: ankyrin repeat domain-containing protein [Spirochaetaceae bacterium]|nr:ankyrin repeat domain-containing protein [Spirochaetaceae bacterium]